MLQVVELHEALLGEGVDFPDGDHVGQHVAQPLGVQEIKFLQSSVIVVQQNA